MASYLNRSEQDLNKLSAIHTAREIDQQPELWVQIWKQSERALDDNRQFIQPLLDNFPDLHILMTGAGTSDFIGKSIEHAFFHRFGRPARAISTTTLVTHFSNYVNPEKPLLLISFARSGNSPESVSVTKQAESYCNNVWHLVITCNPDGQLAQTAETIDRGHVVILPPEANDKSLAMTSSFSGMVLTALLLTDFRRRSFNDSIIDRLHQSGRNLIDKQAQTLEEIASEPFERVVFLGSGPFHSISREAHLKVQELTDGQIVCKYDSFLGFRHGPKAVVNPKTLVFYHFSADPTVQRYEFDLARQIEQESIALKTVGIFPDEKSRHDSTLSKTEPIILNRAPADCPDALIPLMILPAQMLGFYKSLQAGLNPDNPSRDGAISRVVKGVTIYDT
jgi:tagatose-6-phosphate ketose/aldose isomerase